LQPIESIAAPVHTKVTKESDSLEAVVEDQIKHTMPTNSALSTYFKRINENETNKLSRPLSAHGARSRAFQNR